MPRQSVLSPPAALLVLAGTSVAVANPVGFPAIVELSSLDGRDGFVMNGLGARDRFG